MDELKRKLRPIGLLPCDVGGSGDCFFRALSHQMFGNPDKHMLVRDCGITHMNNDPQLYREHITNMEFNAYIAQMSARGTWYDHILIMAVANASHCIIHTRGGGGGSRLNFG